MERRNMHDPHADTLARITHSVLDGPGTLDPAVRQAAANGGDVPQVLARYVDKVRCYAYRVTDEEVRALLAAGYSEDQIFELTISTALGTGLERLRAGLGAIQRASGEER
jgi:alkylhydroperoxidase family enzyme